jgi:formylmethanofuran dehydrogenase subunit E-like metal-binding protein
LGFFALVVFVLFVWLIASLCGAKALATDAIKILSTLATTCAAILGAGQVKSAVVGAVSPQPEATAQPTDKAKVSLNTAKAAMLMAKVQAAPTFAEPSGKLKPPSMGGEG